MRIIALRVFYVAALFIGASLNVDAAVTDDFSDLNDTSNPTWNHLSGLAASTGQVWDASTGQYHLTAPNNGAVSLGFIGSHTGPAYSDVKVTADVVNFVGSPAGAVFGVAARLNGLNGVGQLTGYAYAYEPFADSGGGEMVLYRIVGLSFPDIRADGVENVDYVRKVTLDPNKDYSFSLRITGSQLYGEVREVGGGIVAYQTRTDATHASGYSGLISYSGPPMPPVDVTWDNFKTQVPEPATTLLLVLGGIGVNLLRGRDPRVAS